MSPVKMKSSISIFSANRLCDGTSANGAVACPPGRLESGAVRPKALDTVQAGASSCWIQSLRGAGVQGASTILLWLGPWIGCFCTVILHSVVYITTVVQSHLSWMEKVYPHVVSNPATAPLECMQNEGDIMYVPEGWYHATINIGDTHSIAQRTEDFNDKTSRGLGQQAIRAIMKYRFSYG